jgi:hypothetical protein
VAYRVDEHDDRVEVRGATAAEVAEALALLDQVRKVQAERGAETRDEVVRVLMGSRVEVMPPAALEQARRLAAHRRALLEQPAFDHGTLAELRGDREESATRTWVARRRREGTLFTVTVANRTVIPAFQLTVTGEVRPELRDPLRTLTGAGLDPWTVWTWLTSPATLLDGEVPAEWAADHPDEVAAAARRFVTAPVG